jgi:hypothetical protein
VYEQRLVALWVEPAAAEQAGLLRRSAEVEAGDDPQDADPAQAERSPSRGTQRGASSRASRPMAAAR